MQAINASKFSIEVKRSSIFKSWFSECSKIPKNYMFFNFFSNQIVLVVQMHKKFYKNIDISHCFVQPLKSPDLLKISQIVSFIPFDGLF